MSSFHHHMWDEFEWESYLNEINHKNSNLRGLMEPHGHTPPRWLHLIKDCVTKHDAVDVFIREELLLEESGFPDELQYGGDDDDEDEEEYFECLEDEEEEDEDIEALLNEFFMEEQEDDEELTLLEEDSYDNFSLYSNARLLSTRLFRFYDNNPGFFKNRHFLDFVSEVLNTNSGLAAAYSFGFELEIMGANIAYSKKALGSANRALMLLSELREAPLAQEDYLLIHRKLFALRNDIAIYIQDIRTLFYEQS